MTITTSKREKKIKIKIMKSSGEDKKVDRFKQ